MSEDTTHETRELLLALIRERASGDKVNVTSTETLVRAFALVASVKAERRSAYEDHGLLVI